MTTRPRTALRRTLAVGAIGIVAAVGLTGCAAGGRSASAPVSSVATAPATSPNAATTSGATGSASAVPATAPSSTVTAHTDKPSTDKPSTDRLQPALADYFHDQEGLAEPQAQQAAQCAVYPAYQELSAPSLKAIVAGRPSGILPADEKVLGDVVTECETAAG